MDTDEIRTKLLDAAEQLFYERGIQAVGVDEVRTVSGVSLKRLYQVFPAKWQLVEAYLLRRDAHWRGRLAAYVADHPDNPIPAVFDWLGEWFAEPGFRGCAFVNSFGEAGAVEPAVANVVRAHHAAVREYLRTMVADLGVTYSGELTDQLWLLLVGSSTGAAIMGDPAMAARARSAAETLIKAATRRNPVSL
ncbi:MAG TPA: TetR/AcrR family transcriptional regulator [Pseudonocardiaceae bacterium]|nr:TetR/AcrR family transcriptional regulator [Pseudonocardiaceae bacterium]